MVVFQNLLPLQKVILTQFPGIHSLRCEAVKFKLIFDMFFKMFMGYNCNQYTNVLQSFVWPWINISQNVKKIDGYVKATNCILSGYLDLTLWKYFNGNLIAVCSDQIKLLICPGKLFLASKGHAMWCVDSSCSYFKSTNLMKSIVKNQV